MTCNIEIRIRNQLKKNNFPNKRTFISSQNTVNKRILHKILNDINILKIIHGMNFTLYKNYLENLSLQDLL